MLASMTHLWASIRGISLPVTNFLSYYDIRPSHANAWLIHVEKLSEKNSFLLAECSAVRKTSDFIFCLHEQYRLSLHCYYMLFVRVRCTSGKHSVSMLFVFCVPVLSSYKDHY
jgi:hypothetical protein